MEHFGLNIFEAELSLPNFLLHFYTWLRALLRVTWEGQVIA